MKLKEIPKNTVVHTPTEAEAKELLQILHEDGWKWKSGNELIETLYYKTHNEATHYHMMSGKRVCYDDGESAHLEKLNILTLAGFKERYCEEEKPRPKFKVSDKVIDLQSGAIRIIQDKDYKNGQWSYLFNDEVIEWVIESALEPYTEPETKDETKEAKELNRCEKCGATTQQCMDAPCQDYPVEKELNLCELLKGHEEEVFYHLMYGNVAYKGIDEDGFIAFTDSEIPTIYNDGKYDQDANVVLYPSRALYEQYPLDPYAAWMKWQEEQKKYPLRFACHKVGEEAVTEFGDVYFRTPADRDKCIEEIKAIIEKYTK